MQSPAAGSCSASSIPSERTSSSCWDSSRVRWGALGRLLRCGLARRLRCLVLLRHHRVRRYVAIVKLDGTVVSHVVFGGEPDFPVGGVWRLRRVATLLHRQEGMTLAHLLRVRAAHCRHRDALESRC